MIKHSTCSKLGHTFLFGFYTQYFVQFLPCFTFSSAIANLKADAELWIYFFWGSIISTYKVSLLSRFD